MYTSGMKWLESVLLWLAVNISTRFTCLIVLKASRDSDLFVGYLVIFDLK